MCIGVQTQRPHKFSCSGIKMAVGLQHFFRVSGVREGLESVPLL